MLVLSIPNPMLVRVVNFVGLENIVKPVVESGTTTIRIIRIFVATYFESSICIWFSLLT